MANEGKSSPENAELIERREARSVRRRVLAWQQLMGMVRGRELARTPGASGQLQEGVKVEGLYVGCLRESDHW